MPEVPGAAAAETVFRQFARGAAGMSRRPFGRSPGGSVRGIRRTGGNGGPAIRYGDPVRGDPGGSSRGA
ncbi:hypothetical protein GCM10010430_16400 [Kitasatospora cystarginea]|uniref:Uncharacterized protein n=1 Tax=Kitasatospora cystarginea TaxID=58350 RepID=A0ABN3DM86_9ACTN